LGKGLRVWGFKGGLGLKGLRFRASVYDLGLRVWGFSVGLGFKGLGC
jgi:hypothetical protein